MKRSANISPDGKYRYALTREWRDSGPMICWIMFNPSTADAEKDDPTIRTIIKHSDRWGFRGLHVVNLFPLRTPYPKEVQRWLSAPHSFLPNGGDIVRVLTDNFTAIRRAREDSWLVMAAWGAIPTWAEHQMVAVYGEVFVPSLKMLGCLGTTKSGQPKHPLARGKSRPPSDIMPIPWRLPG